MKITSKQLRQIIREELEREAVQNPLAGRNAAFAMAFSLSPFHPKQSHEIRSFHRLVEIFLNGPNRDRIAPDAQKDLAFISQQVRKGFNDPAYLSRADIEKAFFKLKELFGPDYDSHLINFYDGFESPLVSGGLRSSLDKINNALREISKETGYETSYVKGQRVGAIVDGIAAFKSRLDAIPDSDIEYLTRIHQLISKLTSLSTDDIDPDYKSSFARLINSGPDGIAQAVELFDVLNQPDVEE
jgi:hypothetical protein